MGLIRKSATETRDLGVVAERCPSCDRATPCLVRAVFRTNRVLFVQMRPTAKETFCLCPVCGRTFSCAFRFYAALVPVEEAATLSPEELLARTNPSLAERIELKRQVSALGGDDRFALAYEQLEGMRPGELHAALLKRLLDWGRSEEAKRARLVLEVAACARAYRFAREVAPGIPDHTGCLPAFLVALAVWSAFLWAPVVRNWLWGALTGAAGILTAALTRHLLQARRVRRWTRDVLVPAAQRAHVSLPCFLAIIDDVPGTPLHVLDDLWPVKDQVETIRKALADAGRL